MLLLNRQRVWIRVEENDVRPSKYDSEFKRKVLNFLTMKQFTSREYLDMVLRYGEIQQNSPAAARLYAERFPHTTELHIIARLQLPCSE